MLSCHQGGGEEDPGGWALPWVVLTLPWDIVEVLLCLWGGEGGVSTARDRKCFWLIKDDQ